MMILVHKTTPVSGNSKHFCFLSLWIKVLCRLNWPPQKFHSIVVKPFDHNRINTQSKQQHQQQKTHLCKFIGRIKFYVQVSEKYFIKQSSDIYTHIQMHKTHYGTFLWMSWCDFSTCWPGKDNATKWCRRWYVWQIVDASLIKIFCRVLNEWPFKIEALHFKSHSFRTHIDRCQSSCELTGCEHRKGKLQFDCQ